MQAASTGSGQDAAGSGTRPALKVFPRHVGVWEGTYTRLDAAGAVLDRHASRLVQTLEDGYKWTQKNTYVWPDGRTATFVFPGEFTPDGRLIFDTPRIRGYAWETGEDNAVLTWEYVDEPGTRLWELISLTEPGHRVRTWQHTRNGQFEGLTVIEERKIADREEQ